MNETTSDALKIIALALENRQNKGPKNIKCLTRQALVFATNLDPKIKKTIPKIIESLSQHIEYLSRCP